MEKAKVAAVKISKEYAEKLRAKKSLAIIAEGLTKTIVNHLAKVIAQAVSEEMDIWEKIMKEYKIREILPPKEGHAYHLNRDSCCVEYKKNSDIGTTVETGE